MDIFDLSGEKIRQLREKKGLTRDQLGALSGVPKRTIQSVEDGTIKNPGIETYKAILKGLEYKSEFARELLVLKIITALPALDELELNVLLSRIKTFPPRNAKAKSS